MASYLSGRKFRRQGPRYHVHSLSHHLAQDLCPAQGLSSEGMNDCLCPKAELTSVGPARRGRGSRAVGMGPPLACSSGRPREGGGLFLRGAACLWLRCKRADPKFCSSEKGPVGECCYGSQREHGSWTGGESCFLEQN